MLRYWAGNLHHYGLKPGDGSLIYDSGYREVGRWSITDGELRPGGRPQENRAMARILFIASRAATL
jgi:hypothetical protein